MKLSVKFSVIDGITTTVYGVRADAIALELLKGNTPKDFEVYYTRDSILGYQGSMDDYKREYLKQYKQQRANG